ncbi:DUF6049 family protein [Agromyces sp. MMS24-JH15]|uniref:DUF6049 family protein n=1 Tax=Agromyces sp. MMS24-JH15 TaxID=3243765 RepID=UPI003747C603
MEEADSNSTPRLRRLPRSIRRSLVVLAPLVALCVGAAPVAAGVFGTTDPAGTADGRPVAAQPVDPAGPDTVELHLAPTSGASIDPAAPAPIEVEVVNRSTTSLGDGTIRLSVPSAPLADSAAIAEWADEDADVAVEPVGEAVVHPIGAGGFGGATIPVSAESLATQSGGPVIGLRAELVVDGVVVAVTDAAFAANDAAATRDVSLALVTAITIPPQTAGLADAAQLEEWTGPVGLLTRQLAAVADQPVAVAVDPRIIASIRALGTAAPPTATEWLARLAAISNEVFPLAFGDADLALQAQLGVGVLQPTSFADALDPAAFPATAAQDGGDGDAPESAPATETPAPTEPADPLPSTEELLAWDYTRTDVAWPADMTVAAGNLAVFRSAGLTTSILSAANVESSAADANAASIVDGETALVSDGAITAALHAAAVATSDLDEREAEGRVLAELAMHASGSGERTTLLATFPRGAQSNPSRLVSAISLAAGSPWSRMASFSDAVGAPPTTRTLVDSPEGDPRHSYADRLVHAESEVTAFATVLDDPALLSGPARRQLLSLLDVGWIADPAGWADAVGTWLVDQSETLAAVSVVPSSTVIIVASETGVPTTVQNALPYPVTVHVDVSPSNGRLVVEEPVEVTVGPESRSQVRVPVEAGVGNGDVVLTVTLTSPEGVPVGRAVEIPATVHADWEGLTAAILAAAVVVFFGVGIWRNIRRRRRERAERAAAATATESGDSVGSAESDSDAPTEPEAERGASSSQDSDDAAGPERRDG